MSQYSPFSKEELMPQEEMLEIKKQKGELFIGLPKETHFEEKRVCLTPDAVAALLLMGIELLLKLVLEKQQTLTTRNMQMLVQKSLTTQKKHLDVILF